VRAFTPISPAAFNNGDFEISREFFNRARSQLGYLFDETSIDIAFVLQPMSIVSHWWTGKDSSAYYHTLLSEMVELPFAAPSIALTLLTTNNSMSVSGLACSAAS
jgi:hypothetical protein